MLEIVAVYISRIYFGGGPHTKQLLDLLHLPGRDGAADFHGFCLDRRLSPR